MNVARSRKEHKPYLRWTRLLASTETLERRPGLLVELACEAAGTLLDVRGLAELGGERGRGDLRHLHARGVLQGRVARHEDDVVSLSVLRREPLEHRVRVRRVPHFERTAADDVAETVEHDDPARASHGDVTRERVAQLACVGEPARVEEVVTIEEIEVSHVGDELRTTARPQRPTR